MRENEAKEKNAPDAPQSEESILAELKSAYRSITRLQNTSVHRKITLEIERKIRREHRNA